MNDTAYEFPVERGKIREFATATKTRHAAHAGPDAVVPPTFLTLALPAVGDVLAPREHKPLARSDIVRYAGASGDFNPIHHDETFATSARFPTVFSIGMYQAGLLANFAADVFGPDHVRRVTLRFSAQVWPGDVLTCSGTVTGVDPGPDGTNVEVELTCTRVGADGTEGVAISGSAAFLLP